MGNDTFILTDEIISSGRKSIQKLVDNLICLKIDEIETYDFPKDQVFGLEIIYENALFYLIIRFSSKNKNFLCLAPSRFPRDKCDSNGDIINPPYFSRMKWVNSFDESVIVFADPMIFRNDNINVGWMIGEKKIIGIQKHFLLLQKNQLRIKM